MVKLTDVLDHPERIRFVRTKEKSGCFKWVLLALFLYILFRGDPDLLDVIIRRLGGG